MVLVVMMYSKNIGSKNVKQTFKYNLYYHLVLVDSAVLKIFWAI